jgi:hypothetical protein
MYLTVLLVCTLFAKLELQQGQVKNKIEEYYRTGDMEDGKGPYTHEEEVRALNISVEETKSNGHRKRMESLELVEIQSLKMELQSCRVDNERMLKAREKQNQLNTQLLQSLNNLQKKIKNGSGSRYEEGGRVHSRENHGRSRHSRSATKIQRHHYSLAHSARKPYASEES